MMLQVEQGGQQLTSESCVHPPCGQMLPAESGTLPHRPWATMPSWRALKKSLSTA